jgi:mRNA interferase HigB
VRTLSLRFLREFWEDGHGDSEEALREWFRIAERVTWTKYADVRSGLRSADQVGDKVIFNIKGNEYRLIAYINYASGFVFVKWVGNHREYGKLSRKDIENL